MKDDLVIPAIVMPGLSLMRVTTTADAITVTCPGCGAGFSWSTVDLQAGHVSERALVHASTGCPVLRRIREAERACARASRAPLS